MFCQKQKSYLPIYFWNLQNRCQRYFNGVIKLIVLNYKLYRNLWFQVCYSITDLWPPLWAHKTIFNRFCVVLFRGTICYITINQSGVIFAMICLSAMTDLFSITFNKMFDLNLIHILVKLSKTVLLCLFQVCYM